MSKSKSISKPADEGDLSFEEAVAQLEEIIERVEQGKIGIERALVEYERGVKLVNRCKAILATVEQRIEELGAEQNATSSDSA